MDALTELGKLLLGRSEGQLALLAVLAMAGLIYAMIVKGNNKKAGDGDRGPTLESRVITMEARMQALVAEVGELKIDHQNLERESREGSNIMAAMQATLSGMSQWLESQDKKLEILLTRNRNSRSTDS